MASNKVQKIADTHTRSSRLRVVKTLWMHRQSIFFLPDPGQEYSAVRNLANSYLWSQLWEAGYRIPTEMLSYPTEGEKKQARIKILHSDLETIISLSEGRMFQLYRLFLSLCPAINDQKRTEQKRLFKALLTTLKVAQVNDTINVGASVRARMAFQKEAFGAAIKKLDQNTVLYKLASMGLGDLDSGSSYESGKLPTLSVMKLSYLDEGTEVEDFPIISSLQALGLIQNLVEENPIVSLSCYEEFCLVMDYLDPAAKSFKNYCDSKSEEYKVARYNWNQENKQEKQIEVAAKKVYKPRKPQMTTQERKAVNEGRATLEADKVVWNMTHEQKLAMWAEQKKQAFDDFVNLLEF